MMILRIVLLHFQHVLQHRLRILIWFLLPLMNNLTLILFWGGAMKNTTPATNWTFSAAVTYYVLLTLASSMLTSHIEEEVSVFDIQQGDLVRYLTRPFPYFWIKFIEEIPYRLLQGTYGIFLLVIFMQLFKNLIHITSDPLVILLSFIISVGALFITYTMKMNLGLSAFWFKDARGAFELFTITLIVLSGGIIPLNLLPKTLELITYALPFAYTAFFPIQAFQGNLTYAQLMNVITVQAIWIGALLWLNRIMWRNGIKEFTSHGQ